jgi:hypothetical protein
MTSSHLVYFSLFVVLFLAGFNVYVPLVVVFAVAHSWKFSLFMRYGKVHMQPEVRRQPLPPGPGLGLQ